MYCVFVLCLVKSAAEIKIHRRRRMWRHSLCAVCFVLFADVSNVTFQSVCGSIVSILFWFWLQYKKKTRIVGTPLTNRFFGYAPVILEVIVFNVVQ